MKKKLIALIVAGELLIFSGVVLGYYHPVAGSIFEIIGGLLNLCFFILLLVYAKKNKKKIKDELLEIYSGSEETFCVGKILSKNRDSILFRSYDAQGKNDGLHFIKSSHISEIKSNTQYLRKMQLYLAYWREQEDAPLTNPFKKHPALSGLLAYAMENKKIITVFCSSKPDELLTGYVETYDNKKIKLNCVDMETACIYETATLLKEDIFYLEVDSLDNELLKYANEKIER